MKKLPDENTLIELLEMAKDVARKAREMNVLAITIEEKYEKRLREFKEAETKKTRVNE
jgi:hypothetical protein